MTTLISRMYADRATAEDVGAALIAAEFRKKEFDVIGADGGAPVEKRLRAAGVYTTAAKIYAERLAAGGAVLVMRAPFGESAEAKAILDRFSPMDVGVKRPDGHLRAREPRSRFAPSKTTLLTNDARFMDWIPDLSHRRMMGFMPEIFRSGVLNFIPPLFNGRLTGFIPLLSGSARKTKLFTERTTPFSSAFGLPLLTRR